MSPKSSGKKNPYSKWGQETSYVRKARTMSSPFSYAQLELITEGDTSSLDELTVKSYCTAALKQFLGLTGQAVALDILKAEDKTAWVRVPKEDLAVFSAAVTAYGGTADGDAKYVLRIKRLSGWLGTIVGADDADEVWTRES